MRIKFERFFEEIHSDLGIFRHDQGEIGQGPKKRS